MKAIWIFWPSFVVAGIAEAFFFAAFDPMHLQLFGHRLEASRVAVYTLGFFLLWMVAAASSALTCFFQRSAADINRLCPLEAAQRPLGCPKRADFECS